MKIPSFKSKWAFSPCKFSPWIWDSADSAIPWNQREREEEGSTLSLYCRPAKPVCEHAGCNRKCESFFSNIQWRVSENYGMRLSRWWRGSGFFLQINCLGSYDTAKRRKKSCSTNHIINPYLKNALKISSSSKS